MYLWYLTEAQCGQPFETQDVLPQGQITTSSLQAGATFSDTALYNHNSWCASGEDKQPYILVNTLCQFSWYA